MPISVEQVTPNQIVTQGDMGGLAADAVLGGLTAVLVLFFLSQLWPIAVLAVVVTLILVARRGYSETCTLDLAKDVLVFERDDIKGKHVTERALDEIVALGVGKYLIASHSPITKSGILRPGRKFFYIYLVSRSGECLNLPGACSSNPDEVLDAAKKVHRFLGLDEPIIQE